jgi:hypothetical protein
MRKVYILTGLLLISSMAVCLIGVKKPQEVKPGMRDGLSFSGQTFSYHSRPADLENRGPSTSNKSIGMDEKNRKQYQQEYEKLIEAEQELEAICKQCREVLEKASIDDSVYDQYDNPQGRLQRYKVDRTLKTFFEAFQSLKENWKKQEQLKRKYR